MFMWVEFYCMDAVLIKLEQIPIPQTHPMLLESNFMEFQAKGFCCCSLDLQSHSESLALVKNLP